MSGATNNNNISSLNNNNWLDELDEDNKFIKDDKTRTYIKKPPKTPNDLKLNLTTDAEANIQLPMMPVLYQNKNLIKIAYAIQTNIFHDLTIENIWKNLNSGKNHMYEILTGAVIPYFDYDKSEIKTQDELNQINQDFFSDFNKNMTKVFPKAKLNENIFIMLSSGPSAKYGPFKFSAHVVIRDH